MIYVKSLSEIALMKRAGEIVAKALMHLKSAVAPGMTTAQLNKMAESFIRECGATPSFKNYRGFPASICASINEQVVHGIPGNAKLVEGDIISIDIGACFEGYHADAARTFPVGQISDRAQHLIDVTKESFYKGIEKATPGYRIGDISNAVQTYVEQHGYSVVRKLVGHGIGAKLHEEPDVPNFGSAGKGARLISGMAIAVEPMVNEGTFDVRTEKNGWTEVTCDGLLSAHYENTIVITKGQPEIITQTDD